VRAGLVESVHHGHVVGLNVRGARVVSLGEPVDAQQALRLGMVNRVVPLDRLMDESMSVAEKLAGVKREAMAETKRLFHEVADLPLPKALERGRDTNKRMRNFAQLGKK